MFDIVCFQTINYDANINTIQNHFGKHTNYSQSFLTCLFQLNPFLSCIMKENLLGLPIVNRIDGLETH
jgi:hypothetical protein